MIDDKSEYLQLPLPHQSNVLRVDVGRLRISLRGLDEKARAVDVKLDEKANTVDVTKEKLGLDQVDNTSDIDKPLSNAINTALTNEAKLRSEGQAELDQAKAPKAWLAQSSLTQIEYDVQGRIIKIMETINGVQVPTTFIYNDDDTINQAVFTANGKTRTETYLYAGGVLTGMTATEV